MQIPGKTRVANDHRLRYCFLARGGSYLGNLGLGGLKMRLYVWGFVILITQIFWPPVLAQDRLNGEAIREKIVGNTITIVTQNLQLATGLVENNGDMRGHIGGEKFEGKWFIKNNNELCFDLPEQEFDICRFVVDTGKHIQFFATTGEPRGRAEILQGNPYNL